MATLRLVFYGQIKKSRYDGRLGGKNNIDCINRNYLLLSISSSLPERLTIALPLGGCTERACLSSLLCALACIEVRIGSLLHVV